MIDDLKNSGELKMHQTIKPKFMSSIDSNEKRDNDIVIIGNVTNEIIQ